MGLHCPHQGWALQRLRFLQIPLREWLLTLYGLLHILYRGKDPIVQGTAPTLRYSFIESHLHSHHDGWDMGICSFDSSFCISSSVVSLLSLVVVPALPVHGISPCSVLILRPRPSPNGWSPPWCSCSSCTCTVLLPIPRLPQPPIPYAWS